MRTHRAKQLNVLSPEKLIADFRTLRANPERWQHCDAHGKKMCFPPNGACLLRACVCITASSEGLLCTQFSVLRRFADERFEWRGVCVGALGPRSMRVKIFSHRNKFRVHRILRVASRVQKFQLSRRICFRISKNSSAVCVLCLNCTWHSVWKIWKKIFSSKSSSYNFDSHFFSSPSKYNECL